MNPGEIISIIGSIVGIVGTVVGLLMLLKPPPQSSQRLLVLRSVITLSVLITIISVAFILSPLISGLSHQPNGGPTPTAILSPTPTLPLCPSLGNSTNSKPGLLMNLEDDTSRWGVFPDGNSPAQCVSSPSKDGTALRASLDYGHDFQVYRNLAAVDKAVTFEMSLSFYFTSATHIQALAFSMDKWTNGQRWEWALQWENKSDNTTEAGNPPTWRVWDGYGLDGSQGLWRDTHIMQQLSPNVWHTLDLQGDISSNGQVHYISFRCDIPSNQPANQLGQTFKPASEAGEKLAVVVQLDADAQGAAYQVYVDEVTFQFKPV